MLSAALSVLAGSVIAATPVTPLPWFEFKDYPMKAFEKSWEGVTRFELLVSPDGKIAAEWICSDTLTMMTQIGVYSESRLIGLWLASFKVWIAAIAGFVLGAALFAWLI